MAKRIKPPKAIEAPIIGKTQQPIVFNFSELQPFSYVEGKKDGTFFIKFLERLQKLSGLIWNCINGSARHSFGTEKLYVKDLTKAAENLVPKGMSSLTVFRATGDNHSFLGYRDANDVFKVIFIEYNFGDVYSHG